MSEDLYGDEAPEESPPPAPKPKPAKRKAPPKKRVTAPAPPKIDGYHLRIGIMGYVVDIQSPIPRDQFCDEMVETITTRGPDPNWSGIYHLKKIDGNIVSVRLRSIDVVEEM